MRVHTFSGRPNCNRSQNCLAGLLQVFPLAWGLLFSSSIFAGPISMVEADFVVDGASYDNNVSTYADGLVNALNGQEPSGQNYSPTRIRFKRDVTSIGYTTSVPVPGSGTINLGNTGVDFNLAAEFQSTADRDAFNGRFQARGFHSDIVNASVNDSVPLFVVNDFL